MPSLHSAPEAATECSATVGLQGQEVASACNMLQDFWGDGSRSLIFSCPLVG